MITGINCVYTDATLRIATKGTVLAGTVLGEITTGKVLFQYNSCAKDAFDVK